MRGAGLGAAVGGAYVVVLVLHSMGAGLTTAVLAAALLVLVPALAFHQLRLLRELRPSRLDMYVSSIVSMLVLTGLTLWDGLSHMGAAAMGLGWPPDGTLFGAGVALGVAAVVLIFGFQAVGRMLGLSEPALVHWILPRTGREKSLFFVLSIVAGVGEEIVYRGFLLTALTSVQAPTWMALVLSSAAFGAVHAYQGVFGVARTTALGLGLGLVFVATGSLWPVVVAHTVVDWLVGLVFADRLAGAAPDIIDSDGSTSATAF